MGDDSYEEYKRYLEESIGLPRVKAPPNIMNPFLHFFLEQSCKERSTGQNDFVKITRDITERWKTLNKSKKSYYETIYQTKNRERRDLMDEYKILIGKKVASSAYLRFFKIKYDTLKKQYTNASAAQISRQIGRAWADLPLKDKERFNRQWENQKALYQSKRNEIDALSKYQKRLKAFQTDLQNDKQKLFKKYKLEYHGAGSIKKIRKLLAKKQIEQKRRLERQQRQKEKMKAKELRNKLIQEAALKRKQQRQTEKQKIQKMKIQSIRIRREAKQKRLQQIRKEKQILKEQSLQKIKVQPPKRSVSTSRVKTEPKAANLNKSRSLSKSSPKKSQAPSKNVKAKTEASAKLQPQALKVKTQKSTTKTKAISKGSKRNVKKASNLSKMKPKKNVKTKNHKKQPIKKKTQKNRK